MDTHKQVTPFFFPTLHPPFHTHCQKGKKNKKKIFCDKILVTVDLNWTVRAVSYSSVTQHFREKQTCLGFISLSIFLVKAASHLEEPGIQAPLYEDSTKANKLKSQYLNYNVLLPYFSSLH